VTRVIAGAAGGRRLAVPRGTRTRPTSDRTREALFSAVESMRGTLFGARVLDLYAGSGAVGLESLSRGAAHALLVEADPKALRTLRANVGALGLPGAQVVAEKVERVLTGPPGGSVYDLVFADPPYPLGDDAVEAVLRALVRSGWLAADSVVVVERSSRGAPLRWPAGLVGVRERRYGEGTLWYGRPAPET
jgi:16S rRNA (guanine966-N2)-methyltransferase